MKPEIEINNVHQLLGILRAAQATVPLKMSAQGQSQLAVDATALGVSLIAIDVSDIDSENDFLVVINASLRELRLSDLLGNVGEQRLTHIFLVSSLHDVDASLGAQILSVAQAFSGTSIRFCVLLPDARMDGELGAIRQVLEAAAEVLSFRLLEKPKSIQPSREVLLTRRVADLERSLQRLEERSRVLESRGERLRESLDGVDVASFMESIRPADDLHDAVKSRVNRVTEDSAVISSRLATYE